MTVGRLLAEMSSAELTEWQALHRIEAGEEKDRELARKALSKLR